MFNIVQHSQIPLLRASIAVFGSCGQFMAQYVRNQSVGRAEEEVLNSYRAPFGGKVKWWRKCWEDCKKILKILYKRFPHSIAKYN